MFLFKHFIAVYRSNAFFASNIRSWKIKAYFYILSNTSKINLFRIYFLMLKSWHIPCFKTNLQNLDFVQKCCYTYCDFQYMFSWFGRLRWIMRKHFIVSSMLLISFERMYLIFGSVDILHFPSDGAKTVK